MKILTIVGARPQFIKAAALSRVIAEEKDLEEVLVHTGQHFDQNMSQVFFDEMDIPVPDYNLNINSMGHGAMTGKMLEGIEKILEAEKPSIVLVYGDTNSTLAGALASKKMNIPVAHVEAGLRSFNMRMPEEVNRILTDRISDVLFCPGDEAIDNLKKEGFDHFDAKVFNVGDIMYDAVIHYRSQVKEKAKVTRGIVERGEFLLLTLHRQENTDDPKVLRELIKALNKLAKTNRIVFPVHPRTKKKLETVDLPLKVEMIEPVGYFDMLNLITHSKMVMTDSGGLQKEAYYLNKFCITLRPQTEWVELVDHGFNLVCGHNINQIEEAYEYFSSKTFDSSMHIYGDGSTGKSIIDHLKRLYA